MSNTRLYSIADKQVLPEFENIPVQQLLNLINTSIDHIYIDNINKYTQEDTIKIIQISLEKLRPKGQLSLKMHNYEHICKLYSDNAIKDDKLLYYMRGNQSIFSITTMLSLLNNVGAKVSEINFTEDQFSVHLVSEKQ